MSEKGAIKKSTAQAICDAIKTKEGSIEPIPFNEVADRITALPSAGDSKLQQFIDGSATEITAEDFGDVKTIKPYAFYKNEELTKVTIPDSVENMGQWAFGYCSNLKHLSLSNNFNAISEGAFYSCYGLNGMLIIPDKATYIGKSAFENCYNITSVVLPSGLSSINSNAFFNCLKIAEIINNSSLSIWVGNTTNGAIARYALEVHQGESKIVTEGDYQFYTLSNGKTYLINYIGNDKDLVLPQTYNGSSYNLKMGAFTYSDIASIVLPDGLTMIDGYTFDHSQVASVVIPDTVTEIKGDYAFGFCKSLTNVKLPKSLSKLGKYAFYSSGLQSIVIPNSVTDIEYGAFYYCRSLTEVKIGNGITSINSQTFTNCTALTDIYIDKAEGGISGAPWGATNATIHWNTPLPSEEV